MAGTPLARSRARRCGLSGFALCASLLLPGACSDSGESARAAARPASLRDPALPGQITPHEDDVTWFRYEGLGSYFLCGAGDPENFLYRGERNPDGTRRGDQLELIRRLAGSGANGIYMQAIRSHGGDGLDDHNPFVDSDPHRGLSPEILNQWETWFDVMDEAGITIFLFLYDDGSRVWSTRNSVRDPEREFVEGIVNRFERHRHLIWVIAEEYEERYTPTRISEIAAAIRDADDYDHPIAVHKLHGLDLEEFARDPNIDQFAIQYNVTSPRDLHSGVVEARDRARGRYNLNLAEVQDHGTGEEARRKNWAAAMAGAYVMVLGMDIASTARSDLEDCGRLRAFMESIDLRGMAPADSLAVGRTSYVLAAPNDRYIVYATGEGTGRIGIAGLARARFALRWFDPVTGTASVDTIAVSSDTLFVDPPAVIGAEAALLVEKLD